MRLPEILIGATLAALICVLLVLTVASGALGAPNKAREFAKFTNITLELDAEIDAYGEEFEKDNDRSGLTQLTADHINRVLNIQTALLLDSDPHSCFSSAYWNTVGYIDAIVLSQGMFLAWSVQVLGVTASEATIERVFSFATYSETLYVESFNKARKKCGSPKNFTYAPTSHATDSDIPIIPPVQGPPVPTNTPTPIAD